MEIRDTEAWQAAEWEYTEIHASQMMPFADARMDHEELCRRFEAVLQECPKFYPAMLELGIHRLTDGENGAEEQRVVDGFCTLLELADPEHLEDEIDSTLDNIEKTWRFDISRRCLEIALARDPGNALLHDYLGHALARLGEMDSALAYTAKAVELAPNNHHFRSNLGWLHLMAGNLAEAHEHLTAAQTAAPDDEVVKGNLEIHRYLEQHGGNYFDYLLRPADREQIERLADDEEWDQVNAVCASINGGRMEALIQELLAEEPNRRRVPDLLTTLRLFYRFARDMSQGDFLLDEDLAYLDDRFEPIMHKFIVKFGDADAALLERLCDYLLEYYSFLQKRKVVDRSDFTQFRKAMSARKKTMMEKARRYGEVRRDEERDEEEKERVREELFEGDHVWPFV